MVRAGNFVLELVKADKSKEAFREHVAQPPDNRIFAEVEPGMEYFIYIKSNHSGWVFAKTTVDGTRMHVDTVLKCGEYSHEGIWESTDGRARKSALRFGKTRNNEIMPLMWTGKVQVDFYEARKVKSTGKFPNTTSSFSEGQALNRNVGYQEDVSPLSQSKGVCSLRGHVVMQDSSHFFECNVGDLLDSITLHYCTATGLVANRVLPPWVDNCTNDHSKRRMRSKKSCTAPSQLQEALRQVNKFAESGDIIPNKVSSRMASTVQVTTEAVLIDLTGDDEEDDDEERTTLYNNY